MTTTRTLHTPGPWHYPGTGNLIGGPDRVRVADVGGLERSPEERVANARLIAAAPALLAALESCVAPLVLLGDYIGNEHPGKVGIEPFKRCDILLAARQAIAQARGEVTP